MLIGRFQGPAERALNLAGSPRCWVLALRGPMAARVDAKRYELRAAWKDSSLRLPGQTMVFIEVDSELLSNFLWAGRV